MDECVIDAVILLNQVLSSISYSSYTLAVVNENYPIADIISRLNDNKEYNWKVNISFQYLIFTKPLTLFTSQ